MWIHCRASRRPKKHIAFVHLILAYPSTFLDNTSKLSSRPSLRKMLAKWKVILPLLLGSAAAQQFSDYGYDYDVDYYTPTCKTAIEKTLECDSALHFIVFANQQPTASQLEKLCTKKCKSSLVQLQKEIEKSCPVAQNNLTLQHGGFATAQDNIHELLDGFTKACLKDP
jgi:hypothetical protein